jgi:hypothetical protein
VLRRGCIWQPKKHLQISLFLHQQLPALSVLVEHGQFPLAGKTPEPPPKATAKSWFKMASQPKPSFSFFAKPASDTGALKHAPMACGHCSVLFVKITKKRVLNTAIGRTTLDRGPGFKQMPHSPLPPPKWVSGLPPCSPGPTPKAVAAGAWPTKALFE